MNIIYLKSEKRRMLSMKYKELRRELREYYSKTSYENAKKYLKEETKRLDEKYKEGMSSYEMKVMQYRVIADMIEPVLFDNSPFYMVRQRQTNR